MGSYNDEIGLLTYTHPQIRIMMITYKYIYTREEGGTGTIVV